MMAKSLTSISSVIVAQANKIKFPNRFRGTIIEKWANYWKNLAMDYQQMLVDLRQDMQDDPIKALKWSAVVAAAYGLAKNNPNELDFKDELKRMNNEIILVNEKCRNPQSIDHVRFLQTCYNEDIIHYRNFGLLSVMYTSELNASCDLYKAHCKYLMPTYFESLLRIVDIGVMGRWWNLFKKTTNYDVNAVM